jgi:hypothetical protein
VSRRLPAPKRRFLIEIRGVLHVEAPDGDIARHAAEQWIAALGREAGTEPAPDISIGWLRVWPERDEATDGQAKED